MSNGPNNQNRDKEHKQPPTHPHALAFKTDGEPTTCTPYGSGHINKTYLVSTNTSKEYVLQKINKHVFKNPQAVMENVKKANTGVCTIS